MTSLTRSSITGLFHPRRSETRLSSSAVDRLLRADQSGEIISRSSSTADLSDRSTSVLEQSILQAQMKRAMSCNETMEASIKRLRTESNHSIEDLRAKNESLEHALQETRAKLADALKDHNTSQSTSVFEQKIKSAENEKLEWKLQFQQSQSLHSKETTELQRTINKLKHQLVDAECKLQLSQLDQQRLMNLQQKQTTELSVQKNQIEDLQTRLLESELLVSTRYSSNVVNLSLLDDVKRITDVRHENDRLKKEIELLKLKCHERLFSDDEVRMLRKQVETSHTYRTLIAKQDAELRKLREQLANEKPKS